MHCTDVEFCYLTFAHCTDKRRARHLKFSLRWAPLPLIFSPLAMNSGTEPILDVLSGAVDIREDPQVKKRKMNEETFA